MAKISRNVLIIFCVISFAFAAGGPLAGRTGRSHGREAEQVDDPYKDANVLIEAFVVEVRLSALYELGVSPIGETPDSVSIEKILSCLEDKDKARVISGAKAAVRQRENGMTECEQRIYLPHQTPDETREPRKRESVLRSIRPYQSERSFSGSANILAPDRIYVSFDFDENGFERATVNDGLPPDTVNRQWRGAICLESGRPSIAGSTQDEEKAVFLILCAHVRDG
jgi:hypothetical protein